MASGNVCSQSGNEKPENFPLSTQLSKKFFFHFKDFHIDCLSWYWQFGGNFEVALLNWIPQNKNIFNPPLIIELMKMIWVCSTVVMVKRTWKNFSFTKGNFLFSLLKRNDWEEKGIRMKICVKYDLFLFCWGCFAIRISLTWWFYLVSFLFISFRSFATA